MRFGFHSDLKWRATPKIGCGHAFHGRYTAKAIDDRREIAALCARCVNWLRKFRIDATSVFLPVESN